MGKRDYYKYIDFESSDIEKCRTYDENILFKGKTVDPVFNDTDKVWQRLYHSISIFVYPNSEMEIEDELRVVGGEILRWVRKRDAFAVSMLLAFHPDFLDTFIFNEVNKEKGIKMPEDVRYLLNAMIKL